MDSAIIPQGVKRCSFWQFALWIGGISVFLLWAAVAAILCWLKGLNQTNLNDYFGFGAWITADLAIIALGAGAFFTGLMRYIFGMDELKAIVNLTVIIGFICYSSAIAILGLDVGQPLRGWFIYWHANVHSMLTEVAFCITCYFMVLTIEYLPLILENRQLDKFPLIHNFSHNLHHIMPVFAATGAFLSFFHQGSLGGTVGVLFGRPCGYRIHFGIWPTTFFLFILSAIACGPCFTILITWITENLTRKKLVKQEIIAKLAKISGWLLVVYVALKTIDTVYWAMVTAPKMGLSFMEFYQYEPFKLWILIAEVGVCGLIPAIILLTEKGRSNYFLLIPAALLNCLGITLNRYVMTVQALALPVLPFDKFFNYIPNWAEWVTSLAPFAYGALLISLSYRYLPVFPQEKELNP
ncbi:MAG: menaquinone reductase integral membrane subunit QrcD [Pseudomonadota bacterium]